MSIGLRTNLQLRALAGFALMAGLLALVGTLQSWSLAANIVNLCLVSAIMALGVNVQWGYAGLFSVGTMGFAALGGLTAMLVATPPVTGAWAAGGGQLLVSLLVLLASVALLIITRRYVSGRWLRRSLMAIIAVLGYSLWRTQFMTAVAAIEGFDPARAGFLGGLGLPILFSWLLAAVVAGAAAWLIGRVSLGLRSDYLAIATLGISEIVIALLKNEDWLTRGVKNVSGLPRPVPYEINLQKDPWFIEQVARWHGLSPPGSGSLPSPSLNSALIDASSLVVKGCYAVLFLIVLVLLLWLFQRAQRAPWGRMMRAIRDNEEAARALGKDVTRLHLQVFVVGSAVIGIAGAMLTTLDGQLTPGTYNPLRFTFLIWVMVIIGGSGNNLGAVLGAFAVWFFWIEAEPLGQWLVANGTAWLGAESALREHLLANASHMRLVLMGVMLLCVMRFAPRGLLPEQVRR